MLSLHGNATQVRGFELDGPSQILRLRAPSDTPSDTADVAVARSAAEIGAAVRAGFQGIVILGGKPVEDELPARTMTLPDNFGYLLPGDLLSLRRSGKVRTLFRRQSAHNAFLVTERCNHYCLMCSQPPRDANDDYLLDEIRTCLPLIDKGTHSLGFTGGEPLLDWPRFVQVLADCKSCLPDTAIHVLSNGRAFADTVVASAWASLRHPNLTVGIPIYAAVDHVHDYVVQAAGAFDETVLGILKLKDQGQRVEVRVVLHAITAPRIIETCRWLSRNLPIVDHVALMGLEHTGFAIANSSSLWIDPIDYKADLAAGVQLLAASGVRVSVYNLPLCVLDRAVWPFAVQSISDWKNGYADECDECIEKSRYSGFFTSGRPRFSRGIAPIRPN